MEIKKINTRDLKLSDIPEFGESWLRTANDREDWSAINFALSFDGDRFMGDAIHEFISLGWKVKEIFDTSPSVLKCFGITGLRLLLYMEQRHAKWGDEVRISPYVRSIVQAIRDRLSDQGD